MGKKRHEETIKPANRKRCTGATTIALLTTKHLPNS